LTLEVALIQYRSPSFAEEELFYVAHVISIVEEIGEGQIPGGESISIFQANEVPPGYVRPQVQGPNATGIDVGMSFFRYDRNNRFFYRGYGSRTKDALARVFHNRVKMKFRIALGDGGHRVLEHINVLPHWQHYAPDHLSSSKWLYPKKLVESPWGKIKVYANDLFVQMHSEQVLPGSIRMDTKNGNWLALCRAYSDFVGEAYVAANRVGETLRDNGLIAAMAAPNSSEEAWSAMLACGEIQLSTRPMDSDFLAHLQYLPRRVANDVQRIVNQPTNSAFLTNQFAQLVATVYAVERPAFRWVPHSSRGWK